MKPYVTCGQMKLLEKLADESGLSYYQMMENAGTRAFEIIREHIPSAARVVIFCGKGNNGGDGFVVARKYYEAGAAVTCVLVDGEPVTADAVTNYDLIKDKINIIYMNEFKGADCDLIVDAMYGTGFRGALRPAGLAACDWINGSSCFTAALDIPSGLSGDALDEINVDARAVRADITITFHSKKPVHLQEFAGKYCGDIHIADIGIDEDKFDI